MVSHHLRTHHQANEKDELDGLKEYEVVAYADIDKLNPWAKVDKELIPQEEVTVYELVSAIQRKCLHCQQAPRLL